MGDSGDLGKEVKKLLVVDDEESVISIIKMLLDGQGFEIVSAFNGNQGLKVFREEHPDAVLTDLIMSDMEGIELIRQLRREDPKLPIVVMSGNPIGRHYLHAAEIFGAVASLLKPFTKKELFDALELALHR